MKKYFLFLFAIALLLTSATAFAGVNKSVNEEAIVNNLKVGLTSDNYGLRVSSAYVLGQLVSTKVINADAASEAIIPLLKILKDDNSDEARIVAALALYYLNSGRGALIYGFAAKHDESERFSKFSSLLYQEYNRSNQ